MVIVMLELTLGVLCAAFGQLVSKNTTLSDCVCMRTDNSYTWSNSIPRVEGWTTLIHGVTAYMKGWTTLIHGVTAYMKGWTTLIHV